MQCQSDAKRINAMQSEAMQSNANQCKAAQSNAKQRKVIQSNAKQCNAMQSNAEQCKATLFNQNQKPKHSTCDTGSMLHMLFRSLLVSAPSPAGYTAKPQTQQTHGARRLRRVLSLEQDECEEYYHWSNHFASSSEETWNHSHRTFSPNPRKRRVRRGERCFYEKGTSTIDCQ